jgi:hypothetical protein
MKVRSLGDRPVPVYLSAFFLTNVGVGGFTLATGLALYKHSGTATTFAWLVAVEYALGLVGQFVGGSILDRRDVLNVALTSNTVRAVAILGGGVAFWVTDSPLLLVGVFLVSAFIRPLYRSASFVLVRHVCTPTQLPQVNALRFGLLQAAQLTGLALVGLLYALLPSGAVIAAVALCMLAGTATLACLRGSKRPAIPAEGTASPNSFGENWRQLGRVLVGAPGLLVHLVLGGLPVVIISLAAVLVAPVNDAVDGGSFGIVILDGGGSIGALAAILAVRRWDSARTSAAVGYATVLAIGGLICVAESRSLLLAAVGFLLLGTAAALGATALDTRLQLRADPAIIGRLAVSQEFVAALTAIALIPLLGPLLTNAGVQGAALIYSGVAAVYLCLFLVAAAWLRGRLFDQKISPRADGSLAAAPTGMEIA